jgi:hypothetical protein
MNGYWMLPALLVGIYLAIKLTRWINYFTFGRNRETRKGILGKPDTNSKQGHDDARQDR